MNLLLLIICMIEFLIILYIMLIRNTKNKFNLEDYEYIVLSISRGIIREIGTNGVDIESLSEEVEKQLISELNNENIKIPNKINSIMIRDYIKNIIYINNIIAEINDEENIEDNEIIDEEYDAIPVISTSTSIIDGINKFYSD